MVDVSERSAEFGDDVDFALLTFSDPKYLRAYRSRTGWQHPILTDADLNVYHQFGYERGSVWRVWGWRVFRRYFQIIRKEGFGGLTKTTEDTLQLGGNAVIGPDGSAAWIYHGAGPDDRPSVDTLIAQVNKIRAKQPSGISPDNVG